MRDNKKVPGLARFFGRFLYEGTGYSNASLRMLPSLKVGVGAIQKNSQNNGYKPFLRFQWLLPLRVGRSEYPKFRDWKVVSYNRPKDNDRCEYNHNSKRVGTVLILPIMPPN